MAHNAALAATFLLPRRDVEQQLLLWLVTLHLLPGILATILYVIVAPRVMGPGYRAECQLPFWRSG